MDRAIGDDAWQVVCALWRAGGPRALGALSARQRSTLPLLDTLHALVRSRPDLRFAWCPACCVTRGCVAQGADGGWTCSCPRCGPVAFDPAEAEQVSVDVAWTIRQLRGALGVPAPQPTVEIVSGVWSLGSAHGHDIVLVRDLDAALTLPGALERAASGSRRQQLWLISPKPGRDAAHYQLGTGVVWLPMEERFWLYGGKLSFRAPSLDPHDSPHTFEGAVHGPFSADFATVHLSGWPHGPIRLLPTQASVLQALWQAGGEPMMAQALMTRAGCRSTKPIDLFKLKRRHRGQVEYEGPLQVYRTLVKAVRRHGRCVYTIPLAGELQELDDYADLRASTRKRAAEQDAST